MSCQLGLGTINLWTPLSLRKLLKKLLCLGLVPIGTICLHMFVLCLHLAYLNMFYSLIWKCYHWLYDKFSKVVTLFYFCYWADCLIFFPPLLFCFLCSALCFVLFCFLFFLVSVENEMIHLKGGLSGYNKFDLIYSGKPVLQTWGMEVERCGHLPNGEGQTKRHYQVSLWGIRISWPLLHGFFWVCFF